MHDWDDDDRGWSRDFEEDHDWEEDRDSGYNYGEREDDDDDYDGYYAAPVYGAPVYAAPAYGDGGQNCWKARHLQNAYWRDRNTGHPAAAYDLFRQNQWAFRGGCGAGTAA